MPRPVSDAIADGLPLWDTYEALFFLVTGIFLGLVLGFLFPSVWRSFRRRFRKVDKYRGDISSLSSRFKFTAKNQLIALNTDDENEDVSTIDVDLVSVFVAARYAVQENAFRDAAQLYLNILSSERVSRAQTNKAMFELAQVYSLSGLTERAIETGLELLHRKPAHSEIFKLLLSLCAHQPSFKTLSDIMDTYSGPKSGELAREVSHLLSSSAIELLGRAQQQDAVQLAKLAVRWSPSALEPKLALVEVTSVLSHRDANRPLDQYILGFFVDLAELFRLCRAHSNRTPFFSLSLFRSWSAFFDEHDSDVGQIFERLKGELLSQIGWASGKDDPVFVRDMKILVQALVQSRSSGSANVLWEDALARLLDFEREPSNPLTAYECPTCTDLHRSFRWKCATCQSWDTLIPWSKTAHPT